MKKILFALSLTALLAGCEPTFRYPCQNPDNWDTERCQKPKCDVNRECPEHIFKGQRDPRQGPPPDPGSMSMQPAKPVQGVTCK